MSRGVLFRSVAAMVSALAGVWCAAALTSCMYDSGCGCSAPRSLVEGDFDDVAMTLTANAPASLRDIDVARLVIEEDTVVVHYERGDEPGKATFTFSNMY